MATGPRWLCDEGFTLLELLIAITLLSFVSLMMAGGLRFGATTWATATDRFAKAQDLRIAQSLIRRQLSEALPLRFDGFGRQRNEKLAFEGRPEGVRFVALAPAHAAKPGYYAIDFAVDGDYSERRLVMSWRRLQPDLKDFADDPNDSEIEKSVLIDDIDGAEFSYFGSPGEGQVEGWRARWTDREALPSLIRVRLVRRGRNAGGWPELVVAPMAAADVEP